MQKVLGFGGLFFRAAEPVKLAEWYEKNLGINPVPQSVDGMPWMQEAGPTIFAPFAADTDYFAEGHSFMLNFRVADLPAMLEQLKAAGIEASHQTEMDGVGAFARIFDPEGNPIELWQPA